MSTKEKAPETDEAEAKGGKKKLMLLLLVVILAAAGAAYFFLFSGESAAAEEPVSSGTYDTYLFGPGAIGHADGTNSKVTETETDRNTLSGEDILVNRRHFVLHPRGIKYVGTAAGGGPTNTVLATAASWSRVYEPKNIRIVCLRHKLVNT